jgi:hypothetical protein
MKKIALVVALLLSYTLTFAQSVSVEPAVFKANQEITITFDVSNTCLAEIDDTEPLYIWMWSNKGGPQNGSWGASAETAKMTQVSDNVWSFTLIPADYYRLPVSDFEFINCLIKAKNGGKIPGATGACLDKELKWPLSDNPNITVQQLVFIPQVYRVFPAKFFENDLIHLVYDRNVDDTLTSSLTKAIAENEVQVVAMDYQLVGSGTWIPFVPTDPNTFKLRAVPNQTKRYIMSFNPKLTFNHPNDKKLSRIRWRFGNADNSIRSAFIEREVQR